MMWKCARVGVAGVLLQGVLAAGQTTFTVTPKNQPKETAPTAVLLQYADLNTKIAAALQEPDSTCLTSYATYQTCKAGDEPKKCKAAPKCTVSGVLPQMDWAGVVFHFTPGQDAATLVPQAPVGPTPPKVPKDIKMVQEEPAPTKIPKNIKVMTDDPAPTRGVAGMPGGSAGGVMGGVMGGSGSGGGPTVVAAKPQVVRGPQRISGGVSAGFLLTKVSPSYPAVAKIARLSGSVVLRAILTKQGTVQSLQVASATNPLFENSAIDAVRQWAYRPFLLNGEPTEVDTTITVNYSLNQ